MKENFFIAILLVIIFTTCTALFVWGEYSMKKASRGFSVLTFAKTNSQINLTTNDFSVLDVKIENFETLAQNFSFKILLDQKEIQASSVKIKAGKSAFIKPDEENIKQIKQLNVATGHIYSVEIISSGKKEILTKTFTFSHE